MKLYRLNGKRLAVACSVVVLIVACIGGYVVTKHKIVEQNNTKYEELVKNPEKIASDNSIKVKPEDEVYDEMHKMANTKIITKDGEIWGKEDITPSLCNKLIVEVTKSNYYDKQVLLNMLNRWVKGDFHDAVAEHNYLWDALKGTVGEAIKLK
jgi:hypothetical protein